MGVILEVENIWLRVIQQITLYKILSNLKLLLYLSSQQSKQKKSFNLSNRQIKERTVPRLNMTTEDKIGCFQLSLSVPHPLYR